MFRIYIHIYLHSFIILMMHRCPCHILYWKNTESFPIASPYHNTTNTSNLLGHTTGTLFFHNIIGGMRRFYSIWLSYRRRGNTSHGNQMKKGSSIGPFRWINLLRFMKNCFRRCWSCRQGTMNSWTTNYRILLVIAFLLVVAIVVVVVVVAIVVSGWLLVIQESVGMKDKQHEENRYSNPHIFFTERNVCFFVCFFVLVSLVCLNSQQQAWDDGMCIQLQNVWESLFPQREKAMHPSIVEWKKKKKEAEEMQEILCHLWVLWVCDKCVGSYYVLSLEDNLHYYISFFFGLKRFFYWVKESLCPHLSFPLLFLVRLSEMSNLHRTRTSWLSRFACCRCRIASTTRASTLELRVDIS